MATATATKQYTVRSFVTVGGKTRFEVVNGETGRIAADVHTEATAIEHAAFLNAYHDEERDRDWIPGSRTNWWARNGGSDRQV